MHHICKGVIFYLSSFASHCESPRKLVIQYSHYILICGPLRENIKSDFFQIAFANKLVLTFCNTGTG